MPITFDNFGTWAGKIPVFGRSAIDLRNKRIATYGDSITAGTLGATYRPQLNYLIGTTGGYTGYQFVGAQTTPSFTSYSPALPVGQNFHEGIPGITSDSTRSGFAARWAAHAGADILILHIGTNQMAGSQMEGYKGLLTQIQTTAGTSVELVLCRIVPSPGITTAPNGFLPTLNASIPAMALACADAGMRVRIADLWFTSPDDWIDSLHPGPLICAEMAQRIYDCMTTAQ